MRPTERIKIYLNLLKNRSKNIDQNDENVVDIIKFTTMNLDDLYATLEDVWLENPDWRFTQLCVNTGLIPNLPGMWYYTEDMEFMHNMGFPYREILLWGTYGKNADQPLRRVLLKEMTNEHIEAIIRTQKQLSELAIQIFKDELDYRKEHPECNIYENNNSDNGKD